VYCVRQADFAIPKREKLRRASWSRYCCRKHCIWIDYTISVEYLGWSLGWRRNVALKPVGEKSKRNMFDLIKVIHRSILVPNARLRNWPGWCARQNDSVSINALKCVKRSSFTTNCGDILENDPPLDEEGRGSYNRVVSLTMLVRMVLLMFSSFSHNNLSKVCDLI